MTPSNEKCVRRDGQYSYWLRNFARKIRIFQPQNCLHILLYWFLPIDKHCKQNIHKARWSCTTISLCSEIDFFDESNYHQNVTYHWKQIFELFKNMCMLYLFVSIHKYKISKILFGLELSCFQMFTYIGLDGPSRMFWRHAFLALLRTPRRLA